MKEIIASRSRKMLPIIAVIPIAFLAGCIEDNLAKEPSSVGLLRLGTEMPANCSLNAHSISTNLGTTTAKTMPGTKAKLLRQETATYNCEGLLFNVELEEWSEKLYKHVDSRVSGQYAVGSISVGDRGWSLETRLPDTLPPPYGPGKPKIYWGITFEKGEFSAFIFRTGDGPTHTVYSANNTVAASLAESLARAILNRLPQ